MTKFWLIEYEAVIETINAKEYGLEFAIDTPITGQKFFNHMVEISGWVFALEPDVHIEKIQCKIVGRSFAEVANFYPRPDVQEAYYSNQNMRSILECGFFASIPTYLADEKKPIVLEVTLSRVGQRELVDLCALWFKKARAAVIGELAFTPVIITSAGRSGSTILCRALSQHPSVSVSAVLNNPGELRFFEHFLMSLVIQTGQNPGSDLNSPTLYSNLSALDQPPFLSPSLYFSPDLARLKSFVRESYPRVYQEAMFKVLHDYIAVCHWHNPETLPTHIVEKSWYSIGIPLGHLVFDDFKEIILIRDFRDYLSSRIKYLRKIDQSKLISDEITQYADTFLNQIRSISQRGQSTLVVRYESLASGEPTVLTKILSFLGLESSSAILNKMSSVILERGDEHKQHATLDWELDVSDRSLIECIISEYSAEIEILDSVKET